MQNKKILFSLVALIGFGLFFTMNAFTGAQKARTIQYQYISNSALAADVKNIANWEQVDSASPDCGDSGDLVCRYSYNGDIEAFENFLALPATTPAYLAVHAIATKQ